MDEVQVDVAKSPGFVLCLCHLDGMFPLVVVVPQLGGDEDVLTLYKALLDSSLDALACFLLVLVVVSTIEQTISDFDGLVCISLDTQSPTGFEGCRHIVNGVGRCLSGHFPKTKSDERH